MADVKWIKMMVGMFDGMSFKKIKRARIGGESFRDKLTAIWFELMDLAGRCNHDGAFIDSKGIPFAGIEDIAIQIDRDEEELKLCMAFYEREGMISIRDDVYSLANWSEYQNIEGMEKIRESKRLAQARWRAKQKALPGTDPNVEDGVDSTVDSTRCDVDDAEEEKEEDKEKDIEDSIYHSAKKDFLKNEFSTGFSTELSTGVDRREDTKRRMLGGELGRGLVFLSNAQMDDLLDRLSIEEFNHYVSVIADCIQKGKPFRKKTHYQAILDMAQADRKIL